MTVNQVLTINKFLQADLSESKNQRENESHDNGPNCVIWKKSGNYIFHFQQVGFAGCGFENLNGNQNQMG